MRLRAQQIAKKSTAARPQLGEDHPIGAAHPLPLYRAPDPDQFAENLADLGRGDEIAAGANWSPG